MGSSVEVGRRSDSSSVLGTRFLIYPQPPFVNGYDKPEMVWIGRSAGPILAGPSDDRMYIANPIDPKRPYGLPFLPPYLGPLRPPVRPGPDGHFDQILPGSPDFLSVHSYACCRRVLDICEGYVGRRIDWFFDDTFERLEIVPHIPDWDNAQSGYGFLELGDCVPPTPTSSFALNFDAIAHEMGHLILLSELGIPDGDGDDAEYFAYHESVADFLSLICLLHFDSATDKILRRTGGNLLIHNELDRFSELSDEKQLRSLNHTLRMSDVSNEVHDRSKPFSAALFDSLVEVYQTLLFERGIADLDPNQFEDLRLEMAPALIEQALRRSNPDYERRHFASKAALQDARDIIASSLVRSWPLIDPNTLTFTAAAEAFLSATYEGPARPYLAQIESCISWREIL
ncbi:hypothetical protein GL286_10220 [Paracoccus aestuariivivens]|uniref:Peptidase M4 C-terminal domain-containing protein n=2 Tax=Paracoccus aestuariivivens TaxID=1820333 RepID=A0A6L6JD75_9RHOB|nr:hypothetical protein [Paracoccus aestuariivivens]